MLHSETPCVGSSRIRCTEAREAEGPPQSGRGESEFLPHRIASAVSVLYARFKFCCVHRIPSVRISDCTIGPLSIVG